MTVKSRTPWWVRLGRLLLFLAVFAGEFLRACGEVARVIMFHPTRDLRPGFLVYPVPDLTRIEELLLSYCITLTPGTTAADYDPGRRRMIVHSLGVQTDDEVRENIRRRLLEPILRITR